MLWFDPVPVVNLSLSLRADVFLALPVADSDGESDGSDRVPVPSFQNSFSQAVEAAMLQLDHKPPAKAEAPPTAGQSPPVLLNYLLSKYIIK